MLSEPSCRLHTLSGLSFGTRTQACCHTFVMITLMARDDNNMTTIGYDFDFVLAPAAVMAQLFLTF